MRNKKLRSTGPALAAGLAALFLAAGLLPAKASARRVIETRYWQDEPARACKENYSLPKVHNLPMGVGQVSVDRLFSNGFKTIPPHAAEIGSCYIAVTPKDEVTLEGPEVIRIIRRKYHCRFLGAGAILGDTGEIRRTGEEVYFRGEGPANYTAEDPDCKTILRRLRRKHDEYWLAGEDKSSHRYKPASMNGQRPRMGEKGKFAYETPYTGDVQIYHGSSGSLQSRDTGYSRNHGSRECESCDFREDPGRDNLRQPSGSNFPDQYVADSDSGGTSKPAHIRLKEKRQEKYERRKEALNQEIRGLRKWYAKQAGESLEAEPITKLDRWVHKFIKRKRSQQESVVYGDRELTYRKMIGPAGIDPDKYDKIVSKLHKLQEKAERLIADKKENMTPDEFLSWLKDNKHMLTNYTTPESYSRTLDLAQRAAGGQAARNAQKDYMEEVQQERKAGPGDHFLGWVAHHKYEIEYGLGSKAAMRDVLRQAIEDAIEDEKNGLIEKQELAEALEKKYDNHIIDALGLKEYNQYLQKAGLTPRGTPDVPEAEAREKIVKSYSLYADRQPTDKEVDYWLGKLENQPEVTMDNINTAIFNGHKTVSEELQSEGAEKKGRTMKARRQKTYEPEDVPWSYVTNQISHAAGDAVEATPDISEGSSSFHPTKVTQAKFDSLVDKAFEEIKGMQDLKELHPAYYKKMVDNPETTRKKIAVNLKTLRNIVVEE